MTRKLLCVVVLLLIAVAATASTSATSSPQAVQPKWNIPILTQFAQSFATWDYKKVRALFTPDGVIVTPSDIYGVFHNSKPQLSAYRVDGSEFQHRIQEHLGEAMQVVGTPIKSGSTVVFGWAFSGMRMSGTGLLDLRGGKIVTAIIAPGEAT